MLKNAKLYEEIINNWCYEHQYDIDIQKACYGQGWEISSYPDSNRNTHNFVSVNKNNEVLGMLGYEIDWVSRSVNGIWIIRCAAAPSVLFIRDVLQAVDDVFYKYNLNRIEFMAYADNKAVEGYRKFCKKYGGREVGICRDKVVLMDGKWQDEGIFEILKEDYDYARRVRENRFGRE